MMLVSLIVLFAVIGVATATPNLRATAGSTAFDEDHDVPHNAELGLKLGNHFRGKHNSSAPVVRKKFSPKGKKSLSENRYFVSRRRANGDCTGAVIDERFYITDECLSGDGDYSRRRLSLGGGYYLNYKYTCSTEGDLVSLKKDTYYGGSNQCNAEDHENCYELNGDKSKCQVDTTLYPYRGATVKTASCNELLNVDAHPHAQTPGLGWYYTSADYCDGDLAVVRYMPFGVCQLFMDYQNSNEVGEPDANTRFYYIQMTSCSDNGIVKVLAYSDPACSRAIYKTHFDLTQSDQFEYCAPDGTVGLWGSMGCVNGLAYL